MPEKIIKILSIDLDYFQDGHTHLVQKVIGLGTNKSVELNKAIMMRLITENPGILNGVYIDTQKMDYITEYLYKGTIDRATLYVAENHGEMVNILNKYMDDKDVKFVIHNIDNHHDIMYRDEKVEKASYMNKQVTCANWVGYFDYRNKLKEYVWINTEHSDVSKFPQDKQNYSINPDLALIEGHDYDYVFICKSESWVLPYFDMEWDTFSSNLIINFKNVMIVENRLMYNRVLTHGHSKEFFKSLKKHNL